MTLVADELMAERVDDDQCQHEQTDRVDLVDGVCPSGLQDVLGDVSGAQGQGQGDAGDDDGAGEIGEEETEVEAVVAEEFSGSGVTGWCLLGEY